MVARLGPTDDLPDSVVRAEWTGSLGKVELTETVDRIRLVHAFPELRTGSHSFHVDCVRFAPEVEIPVADPEAAATMISIGALAALTRRRRLARRTAQATGRREVAT